MTTTGKSQHDENDLMEPLLVDNPESSPKSSQAEEVWLFCGSTMDHILQLFVSLLLPALLTLQFRLALSVGTSHYPMTFLYAQIFFFGVAGWLYRVSLTGGEDILIQLWPEISTDVLLLLILYQQTSAAIFLLDVVSLALAIHAIWNYCDQMVDPVDEELDGETRDEEVLQERAGREESSNDETMPLAVVV